MHLDHRVVRALAVPSRVTILDALETGATPTQVSDEVEMAKSTVVSHLAVLEDAGLVEKDVEEGRRRVIYRPTDTARAIVEGRTRTVTFSLLSALVGVGGGAAVLRSAFPSPPGGVGTMAVEPAGPDPVLAGAGAALVLLGVAAGFLAWQVRRLR